MERVESFELDHRKVKAPYVRKCCVLEGPNGDKVTKFDLRFLIAVMKCLLYPETSIVCCDSKQKDEGQIIKFKNGSILVVEHMLSK